jgi:uncharacterized protein YjdB
MSPTKTLMTIATSPATADISIGAAEQFTATGTYSDGSTADVTASASWTDANTAVATISTSGMAKAVAAGSTTITAAMGSVSGSATLTVPAATKTVTSIAVSPATATVAAGATQQFAATATYSDGSTANVTATASWTTSNAAVATVSSAGLATALASGSATVTATLSGVSASATVTVPVPVATLTSIAVSPATGSIAAKATQQFTAMGKYSDGSTADLTGRVSWRSSNTAVATVNTSGLATAVAAGSTTITASLSGVSGIASLTVTPTLSTISITPNPANIKAGSTQQFAATATYSDGTTQIVTATAAWTSSKTAVATVNASGLASGVAAGSATITASLSGVSGTAILTVTPTLSTISITPNSANIKVGATQQFTATATYSDGSTQNVTATAVWTDDKAAVATVGAAGLATSVAPGSTNVTASFSGISGTATLNVTNLTSISVSPSVGTFAVGSTQQYTATATYVGGSTGDVTATAKWSVANDAVATISSGGLATGVATGSTSIAASLDGTSGSAPVTVTIAASTGVNVPTWHVDNNRSGLNPNETSLTPTNVAPKTFGKLFSYLVDAYAYAEPLLMSNVTINGAAHNVLYVATENDTVYAFDADTYGAALWQKSLLQPGEAPIGGPIQPYEGVTSTPVIDPATGTIYVVSVQKPASGAAGFRLNALDITTGAHKFGSPMTITASLPGTNSNSVGGTLTLPTSCIQRAALLLANGTIYMGFGSCYSGWLLSYDAHTLARTGVFNASPNIDGEGTYGGAGGIWMGSGGPVADSAGNVYVSTGNGPWDTTKGSWGDSILKFSKNLAPDSSGNQVQDYFTPADYQYMNCQDSDLAAGGLMMVPGSGQIMGGGKMGRLYLLNTANLGQEAIGDPGAKTVYVEQGLSSPYTSTPPCVDSSGSHTATINSYEIFGTSAWFNGSVYIGVTPTSPTAPAGVRRFTYSSGGLTPAEFTSPSIQENTRGTTPFISANGTSDGILWMIDEGQPIQSPSPTNATLRAYDAGNLSSELYSSSTNSGDVPGFGIKFTSPIVANGKVYISTAHDPLTVTNPQGEIDVYGLK